MIKIKKIKPLFTNLVTTGEKYEQDMYDAHGLIECKKGDLKTYQTVVAVGPLVRDIQPGDKVMINVMNYAVRKYDPNSIKNDMDMNKVIDFKFNWVQVDDEKGEPQDCLFLSDRDILFSFEGEEVQGNKNPIITPEKPKIIIS
jgi:hypothetical protein